MLHFASGSGLVDKSVTLTLHVSHAGLVDLEPIVLELSPLTAEVKNVTITGRSPGHVEITGSITPEDDIE